ncbi:hypothetical protein D3C76_1028970 [compost metagenome]
MRYMGLVGIRLQGNDLLLPAIQLGVDCRLTRMHVGNGVNVSGVGLQYVSVLLGQHLEVTFQCFMLSLERRQLCRLFGGARFCGGAQLCSGLQLLFGSSVQLLQGIELAFALLQR